MTQNQPDRFPIDLARVPDKQRISFSILLLLSVREGISVQVANDEILLLFDPQDPRLKMFDVLTAQKTLVAAMYLVGGTRLFTDANDGRPLIDPELILHPPADDVN